MMVQAGPDDAPRIFETIEAIKADLRRLELLGRPVVAAINGAALGGGLEIALACHHRIAVEGRYELGLPEVSLGLLPGGGGVTRLVRMFGMYDALMGFLLTGTKLKPAQAKEKGLVDEVVATQDELVPAAKAWILANKDVAEAASQPWDRPGYKMPGAHPPTRRSPRSCRPSRPTCASRPRARTTWPRRRSWPRPSRAPVDFDTASRIESRYLTSLVTGPISKNMIQAFFFDLQAINLVAAPRGRREVHRIKVGVLGAGMMGAGIAYLLPAPASRSCSRTSASRTPRRARATRSSSSTRPSTAAR